MPGSDSDATDAETTPAASVQSRTVVLPEPMPIGTLWNGDGQRIQKLLAAMEKPVDLSVLFDEDDDRAAGVNDGEVRSIRVAEVDDIETLFNDDAEDIPDEELSARAAVEEKEEAAGRALLKMLSREEEVERETVDLEAVLDELSAQLGVAIVAHEVALDELGIGLDNPVARPFREPMSADITLRHVLSRIDPELTWGILNEMVTVTTKEVESENLIVRFYDVADLTAAYIANSGVVQANLDPVIELITTTIEPDTWEEAGGAGYIAAANTAGIRALVVGSTLDEHVQIERLLENLRQMQHKPVVLPACHDFDAMPHMHM